MRPRAARISNNRSSSDFVPPGRASQAGHSERPSYGDRPKRDVDRPTRSFTSDRPARSERPSYGDRPKRDVDRPTRSFSSDRPARSVRPSYGDRPKRDGDRPTRSFSSDRPARSDRPSYGDRPARSERPSYGDRPARSERSSYGDRPARSERPSYGDRPARSERPSYGDRPKRPSFGERPGREMMSKGERISNLRKDLEQLESGTGNLHAAKEWNMGNSDRMLQEAFGESSMDLGKTKFSRSKVRTPAKERKAEGAAPKDTLAWPMRLNRFVSLSGLCSRRTADELIEAGRITINGNVANVLGTKVEQSDVVKYDDELLQVRRHVYVLLNKPKDFITTLDDPENRRTVMELVADATSERIVPAGRLDRNTTGLLLLTNDGDLIQKLTHPSSEISKIYAVELDKPLTQNDFNQVLDGLELEDGFIRVDALAWPEPRDKKMVGLSLHSGKNRIVRRIFEQLGYEVQRLDRVSYAGLTKKDLPRGHWRYLTDKEIRFLRAGKKMV